MTICQECDSKKIMQLFIGRFSKYGYCKEHMKRDLPNYLDVR